MSNTLGTRVLSHSPGACAARPAAVAGAAGALPSGAVSSGGASWGGAGAAASTRISQPLESVRSRGGAPCASAAAGAARAIRAVTRAEERRITAITVAGRGDRV